MPSKAVADAVEARIGANWTAGDGTVVPVFGINSTTQTPADGSPFLSIQYPVANGEQVSIGTPGAHLWREEGVIRFVLGMPTGQGAGQGLQWADEIATLFRGKQFNHVSTYAPSVPVIDDANEDGQYYVLSFAVPYYLDQLG